MRVALPIGTYLVSREGEYETRLVVEGCKGLEGKEAAFMGGAGLEYTRIIACEPLTTRFKLVKGEAFSALIEDESDLVWAGDGRAVTPTLQTLGKVRRFEYQHLAHILAFALARSGGEGIEEVWDKFPGDATKHAPIALLRKVGGVAEVLWGVALGSSVDVVVFLSGLARGMDKDGARIRLDRESLQAFTFILRRGGVRHFIEVNDVVIRSVMDVLAPHKDNELGWVEQVRVGGEEVREAVLVEVEGHHPIIAGYVGWYLIMRD